MKQRRWIAVLGIPLLLGLFFCSRAGLAQAPTPAPKPAEEKAKPAEGGAEAQPAEAKDAPVAVVTETSFDAGKLKQGALLEHAFVVKNTGKGDLNITNAKPG